MNASVPFRDHYLTEHGRLEASLSDTNDSWLRKERQSALTRFVDSGFPTPREESWKYTDLRALDKRAFLGSEMGSAPEASVLTPLLPARLEGHRLVFVNGHFAPSLSVIGPLPQGAKLASLAAEPNLRDSLLREQLNTVVNGQRSAITDLNTAFMTDGLCLELADGVALDQPVHVLFAGRGAGMANLRNLIRLGRGSEVTLIEHYVGLDDGQYLTNAVTEIQLAPNARLTRCKLQQESSAAHHLSATFVAQARDSHARLHGVDLGGHLVRNDSQNRLEGIGAQVQLHGVYAPSGHQHMDNHTRIDHLQPHGTSRETYKGVLDGHGRGVFNGKIVVHQGAQKTDSKQSSAALLLSRTAEVDAKPELEIYADDVKCAHGATVGQLDEDAVFYLQSRGVDKAGARNILTYSFADEVIKEVGIEPLRRHIEAHFMAKLPNSQLLKELL